VRQQENESLEDFAHKVYVLALDGYEKLTGEDDICLAVLSTTLSSIELLNLPTNEDKFFIVSLCI
jgi:type IV secretory pathway component VirB8